MPQVPQHDRKDTSDQTHSGLHTIPKNRWQHRIRYVACYIGISVFNFDVTCVSNTCFETWISSTIVQNLFSIDDHQWCFWFAQTGLNWSWVLGKCLWRRNLRSIDSVKSPNGTNVEKSTPSSIKCQSFDDLSSIVIISLFSASEVSPISSGFVIRGAH